MIYFKIIFTYIPYIIKLVKRINEMRKNGYEKKEIKMALEHVDHALSFASDDDANAELSRAWLSDIRGEDVGEWPDSKNSSDPTDGPSR